MEESEKNKLNTEKILNEFYKFNSKELENHNEKTRKICEENFYETNRFISKKLQENNENTEKILNGILEELSKFKENHLIKSNSNIGFGEGIKNRISIFEKNNKSDSTVDKNSNIENASKGNSKSIYDKNYKKFDSSAGKNPSAEIDTQEYSSTSHFQEPKKRSYNTIYSKKGDNEKKLINKISYTIKKILI
jgi:hypothetical protein